MAQKASNEPLVLFDVGGVLLQLTFARYYKNALRYADAISARSFEMRYKASNIELLFAKGALGAPTFCDRFREVLGNPKVSDQTLKSLFHLRYSCPIRETITLKQKLLRSGHTVALFSNTTPWDFAYFQKQFPALCEASHHFLSYELGTLKPQRGMFRAADRFAKKKGLNRCIIIEDTLLNCRKAVDDFGWEAIWLKAYIDHREATRLKGVASLQGISIAASCSELEHQLVSLGLLI